MSGSLRGERRAVRVSDQRTRREHGAKRAGSRCVEEDGRAPLRFERAAWRLGSIALTPASTRCLVARRRPVGSREGKAGLTLLPRCRARGCASAGHRARPRAAGSARGSCSGPWPCRRRARRRAGGSWTSSGRGPSPAAGRPSSGRGSGGRGRGRAGRRRAGRAGRHLGRPSASPWGGQRPSSSGPRVEGRHRRRRAGLDRRGRARTGRGVSTGPTWSLRSGRAAGRKGGWGEARRAVGKAGESREISGFARAREERADKGGGLRTAGGQSSRASCCRRAWVGGRGGLGAAYEAGVCFWRLRCLLLGSMG